MTTIARTPRSSTSNAACETCPMASNAQLIRLGVNTEGWDYVVALAGNPNTGKSTVFNALTGLRQHTGNWPGKTVSRAEGGFLSNNKRYKVVDLPGTYSLLSTSVDEEIARDFILFGQPSVTVIVVDATRLERNLNLVLQILEITDKAVVCLNLVDEAKRHGIIVDERALARELGVPVVPTVARRGEGIPELLNAINQVVTGEYVTHPHRINNLNSKVAQAVDRLVVQLEALFEGLPNASWVAMRLLNGDEHIMEAVRKRELGDLTRGNSAQSLQDRLVLEAV